jgi:hypothetical protein
VAAGASRRQGLVQYHLPSSDDRHHVHFSPSSLFSECLVVRLLATDDRGRVRQCEDFLAHFFPRARESKRVAVRTERALCARTVEKDAMLVAGRQTPRRRGTAAGTRFRFAHFETPQRPNDITTTRFRRCPTTMLVA